MTPLAEACLREITSEGYGDKLSLGGGLGLLHYLDFRDTHDVDAWWEMDVPRETRDEIISTIDRFLSQFGRTRIRKGTETVSVELLKQDDNRKVFSFQVAFRSAQLEPANNAPWLNIKLDSLADLVAAKTAALIERGAPRDFVDIHRVCSTGAYAPSDCWRLWIKRQQLAGEAVDIDTARLQIETHLLDIELRRPLETIADTSSRVRAGTVRKWFREAFLNAAVD